MDCENAAGHEPKEKACRSARKLSHIPQTDYVVQFWRHSDRPSALGVTNRGSTTTTKLVDQGKRQILIPPMRSTSTTQQAMQRRRHKASFQAVLSTRLFAYISYLLYCNMGVMDKVCIESHACGNTIVVHFGCVCITLIVDGIVTFADSLMTLQIKQKMGGSDSTGDDTQSCGQGKRHACVH